MPEVCEKMTPIGNVKNQKAQRENNESIAIHVLLVSFHELLLRLLGRSGWFSGDHHGRLTRPNGCCCDKRMTRFKIFHWRTTRILQGKENQKLDYSRACVWNNLELLDAVSTDSLLNFRNVFFYLSLTTLFQEKCASKYLVSVYFNTQIWNYFNRVFYLRWIWCWLLSYVCHFNFHIFSLSFPWP